MEDWGGGWIFRRSQPQQHGYVDVIDELDVCGWTHPPVRVSISVDGKIVGEGRITEPRLDAQAVGYDDARGFSFRLGRHLKPGANLVEVSFPNSTIVPGGRKIVHYDPTRRIDDHWSKQYSDKEALIVRWWQSEQIVSHINRHICGEHLPGLSMGLYRWLLKDYGPFPVKKGVSVGCGEGTKEMDVLRAGIVQEFDLFELSAFAIDSARATAVRSGLQDRMHFHHGNAFDYAGPYDLVFWNNSLHHMFDVAFALSWSKEVLRPGGFLVMDEYVGPTRMQFPQWILDDNTAYRESLPATYKVNPYDRSSILPDRVENPDPDILFEIDPSEAADSDNILPQLEVQFPGARKKLTGGMIYHLGLNDILHNFHNDLSEIGRMLEWDDRLLARGATQYAVAVARR
jgi:SAM-dependent methyltransferase